jgi:hypothetical protein
MSGNTIITNSYRKWLLACVHNNIAPDPVEAKKRFYKLHVEEAANSFCHVYAFLVLALRYRELPCAYNIPNNIDGSPQVRDWDLPDGYVERFLRAAGIDPARDLVYTTNSLDFPNPRRGAQAQAQSSTVPPTPTPSQPSPLPVADFPPLPYHATPAAVAVGGTSGNAWGRK